MLTRRSGSTQSCDIPAASDLMASAFRDRYRAGLVPRQRDILMALTSTVWDSDSSPSASDQPWDSRASRGCFDAARRRRTWGTCTAESLSGPALESRVGLREMHSAFEKRSEGGGCDVADEDDDEDDWETYVPSRAHDEELEAENATWARGVMRTLEGDGEDAEADLVYELSTQKLQSESSGPLPTAPQPLGGSTSRGEAHGRPPYPATGERGLRHASATLRSSSTGKSCEAGVLGPGSTAAMQQPLGLRRRNTGPHEYWGSSHTAVGPQVGPAQSEAQHGDLGSQRHSLRRKVSAKKSAKQLLCRRARSWGISDKFPEVLIFPGALPSAQSMGRAERRPTLSPPVHAPHSRRGPAAAADLLGVADVDEVQAMRSGDSHSQAPCPPQHMLFSVSVGYNVPTSSDTPTSPDPASPKPLFPSHARRLSASAAAPGAVLQQVAGQLANNADMASPLQADEVPYRENSKSSNSSYPVPAVPAQPMERPPVPSRCHKSGAPPKMSGQQRNHHERMSSWDSSDMDGSYAFSPSQFLRQANDTVAGHSPSRRASRRTQSCNSSRFRPLKVASGKPGEATRAKDPPHQQAVSQGPAFVRRSTWAPRPRAAPVSEGHSQGLAERGRRESGAHLSGVPRHPRSQSGIPATAVPYQRAPGGTRSPLIPRRTQGGAPEMDKRSESPGSNEQWQRAKTSGAPGLEAVGLALHRRATTWGSPAFVCNKNILQALAEISSDDTSDGGGAGTLAAPVGGQWEGAGSGSQSDSSMVKGFLEGLLWGEGAISRPMDDEGGQAGQASQGERKESNKLRRAAPGNDKEASVGGGASGVLRELSLTRETTDELARLGLCATDLSDQGMSREGMAGRDAAAPSLSLVDGKPGLVKQKAPEEELLGPATQRPSIHLARTLKSDAPLAGDGRPSSSVGPLSRQLPLSLALSGSASVANGSAPNRTTAWKGKRPQLTLHLPESGSLKPSSSKATGQGPGLPKGVSVSARYQRSGSGSMLDPLSGPNIARNISKSNLPPVSPWGSSSPSIQTTEMFTRNQTAPSASRCPYPLASPVLSSRSGTSPTSFVLHQGSRPPVSPYRPLYSPSSYNLTSPCLTSPTNFSPSLASPATASSRPPLSPTSPWLSSPGVGGPTKSPDGQPPPHSYYRKGASPGAAHTSSLEGKPCVSKSPKGVLKTQQHGRAASVVSSIVEELVEELETPKLRKSVSFSSCVTVHTPVRPGLGSRGQSLRARRASTTGLDLGPTDDSARSNGIETNQGALKNRRRRTNEGIFMALSSRLEDDEVSTSLSSSRLSAPARCEGAAESVSRLDLSALQSRFPTVSYEYIVNKYHGRTLMIDVPDF